MSGLFLIEVAIEPKAKADREKLDLALAELVAADPFLSITVDRESGQTILKGTDETHLDGTVDVLKRVTKINVDVGAPQVSYRETLSRKIEKDYTYKRHKGGTAQFARVKLIFEPEKAGAGAYFESKIAGGAVPEAYIAGVEAGIKAAMKSGLLAGFPVVDVKAILIDGAFHDVDSSVEAFEIASRAAFREALKGASILLEPIMEVEVTAPEDYLGFVTGDLRARRAKIQDQRKRDDIVVIDALVPLANTFGYANQLRSGTQSRGTFSMRFSHYAPAPLPPDSDGPSAPAIALRAWTEPSDHNFKPCAGRPNTK